MFALETAARMFSPLTIPVALRRQKRQFTSLEAPSDILRNGLSVPEVLTRNDVHRSDGIAFLFGTRVAYVTGANNAEKRGAARLRHSTAR